MDNIQKNYELKDRTPEEQEEIRQKVELWIYEKYPKTKNKFKAVINEDYSISIKKI